MLNKEQLEKVIIMYNDLYKTHTDKVFSNILPSGEIRLGFDENSNSGKSAKPKYLIKEHWFKLIIDLSIKFGISDEQLLGFIKNGTPSIIDELFESIYQNNTKIIYNI
jgi:hypothetical protein